MYTQEEFVVVNAPMSLVESVMTERELMDQWTSPAVRFVPLNGWHFDQGSRWRLTLTGIGWLPADYVVYERRPGLILWTYNGFWEGFDAWHWFPLENDPQGRTVIQNRLEYEMRVAFLDLIWPFTFVPFMDWDAKLQMQRLRKVCESFVHIGEEASAAS